MTGDDGGLNRRRTECDRRDTVAPYRAGIQLNDTIKQITLTVFRNRLKSYLFRDHFPHNCRQHLHRVPKN